MADIKVDGQWLSSIGKHGSLRWSHVADGGCEQASWQMTLPDTYTNPHLVSGVDVEIKLGSGNLWYGIMAEPDVDEDGWNLTAIGASDEAASCVCFDGALNTTSTPDIAIDQGIARGMLPWTRPTSISAVPFATTDTTDNLNYVSELLDAYSDSVGKRWGVDAKGKVYMVSDPTTPTWFMTPGSARIGLADDDYASNIYLRYQPTATTYATVAVADSVAAGVRRREHKVDATSLGVTTAAKVTNIGNGMLAKGKARYAWTHAVTPARLQLTNTGGRPAFLPFVKAGQMVRTFGVINVEGVIRPYYDWVIGRTEYEDGSDTITLAPVNLAARDLGDVLALAVS